MSYLAFGVVNIVPDDSVFNVAVQTLSVAVLGLAVPGLSLVGAKILGDLKK